MLGRVEALFLNLGGRLTLAIAEVEEAGAHDLRDAFDFNLLDVGGVDREGAFDAFAEGEVTRGRGSARAAISVVN